MAESKKIVILGGGFAGISTAMELGKRTRHNADIEVHLVSDENYFVFQPLLPEVVACGIEPSHVINPIRQLCRHVSHHCATVESIDTQNQIVTLVGNDARRIQELKYDHLVICLGLTMNFTRIPGMTEHSLPIKTLGDAFHLRNHIISKLEEADIETDERARAKALTFVTVGGGFSGVETIAEINDMIHSVARYYPQVQASKKRIVLVHSRSQILNELSDKLSKFAEKKLRQRGVEIILNNRVKEATPDGIVLSNGQLIESDTVICTVGNSPHPLLDKTTLPREKGRVQVDEFLRVQAMDNVWSLGDSALVPDVKRGGFCPPTAQYAMRQGRRCALNILADINGRKTKIKPFVFGGLGQLAVVGHHSGVAEVMGLKITGILAWWMWRSVYFMKLPGLRCKIRVGIDWALDTIFPRDINKIALQRTDQLRRAHYREGDTIITQGEIGDRFYIIESGEVEMIQAQPGQPENQVAIRKAGESFGEIALLKDVPRTATVRCLTPVDVITFTRNDFKMLVGSYESFRSKITDDMTARDTNPDPS